MWLINTQTLELEEFSGVLPPPYAILSHTWEDGEVLFRDMINGASSAVREKKGYAKIEQTCRIALDDKLNYAWVDTCCIDKSSSAELSEAINSMFQWYKNSVKCYAYLSDLGPKDWFELNSTLPKCRYWTRSWTLQELIAPRQLVFYDSSWTARATKDSEKQLISEITRIPVKCLQHYKTMMAVPVAQKMFWAARRQATRVEDTAYCLLGLFDINMPMLYGEGPKAFIRLQEEIVRKTCDLSLLAWSPSLSNTNCGGVLAYAPFAFGFCDRFLDGAQDDEFSVTNKGIRISTRLFVSTDPPHFRLLLGRDQNAQFVFLVLQKQGPNEFVRDNSISQGLRTRLSLIEAVPLEVQTIYLRQNSQRGITQVEMALMRHNGVQLEMRGGLKVFEAHPQGNWDPAHSLLQRSAFPVVLVVGHSSSTYGFTAILILGTDIPESIYALPAASETLPYVLKNLPSLRPIDLQNRCNLYPVWISTPTDWNTELHRKLPNHVIADQIGLHLTTDAKVGSEHMRLRRLTLTTAF